MTERNYWIKFFVILTFYCRLFAILDIVDVSNSICTSSLIAKILGERLPSQIRRSWWGLGCARPSNPIKGVSLKEWLLWDVARITQIGELSFLSLFYPIQYFVRCIDSRKRLTSVHPTKLIELVRAQLPISRHLASNIWFANNTVNNTAVDPIVRLLLRWWLKEK